MMNEYKRILCRYIESMDQPICKSSWFDGFINPYVQLSQWIDWVDVTNVDVFVTSECIHSYILCIVPQCLFWDVSVM